MRSPRRKNARIVSLVATVFLVAAIAGCLHESGDDEEPAQGDDNSMGDADGDDPINGDDPFEPTQPEPQEPRLVVHAALEVEPQVVWADTQVNFTGEGSGALEGEVTEYVFDPGTGNETGLEPTEEPEFTHTYEEGGVYVANLTVVAEGGNETAQDTASVAVFVQERHELPEDALDAGYLVLASDEEHTHDYTTRIAATFFEVSLEVSDESALGDASGSVTFTGPGDEELASEEIDGGGTVELSGMFNFTDPDAEKEHTLSVVLEEGEIEYTGEVVIYYGIDPEQHDIG